MKWIPSDLDSKCLIKKSIIGIKKAWGIEKMDAYVHSEQ
jgi:hypothetical protein